MMQLRTEIISGKQVMMLKTIIFHYSQLNYLHLHGIHHMKSYENILTMTKLDFIPNDYVGIRE